LHIRKQQPHPPHPLPKKKTRQAHRLSLARCSQPLSTNQTPHPTTKQGDNTPPRPQPKNNGLVVSKPNSVSSDSRRPSISRTPITSDVCCCTRTTTHYRRGPSNESLSTPNPHTMWAGHESRGAP
jgi:hypothetical protein